MVLFLLLFMKRISFCGRVMVLFILILGIICFLGMMRRKLFLLFSIRRLWRKKRFIVILMLL